MFCFYKNSHSWFYLGEMLSGCCLFSGLGCGHCFLLWREAKLVRSPKTLPLLIGLSRLIKWLDVFLYFFHNSFFSRCLWIFMHAYAAYRYVYVCSFAKICSCTFRAAIVKTVVSLQQVWVISLWTEDIEVQKLIYKETLQWGWDDHLTYTDFQSWHTWKWGAIWS